MTGSGVVTQRPHEMKMAGAIVFHRKVLQSHSAQRCTMSPLKRQLRTAVYVIALSSVFELANTVFLRGTPTICLLRVSAPV